MDNLKHLFPRNTSTTERYTYAKGGRGKPLTLPPRDRVPHASNLIRDIEDAEEQAKVASANKKSEDRPRGTVLDFESDPGFKLQLGSLEYRSNGIELRNSRTADNVMHAAVFVPQGKIGYFVGKFVAYCNEDNKQTGKPKNQRLVESIGRIQLAALESFWTDIAGFPYERDKPIWWEVWLLDPTTAHDVSAEFRRKAQSAGIEVGPREIRFPERIVLLAHGTVEQIIAIENLFDILAELRLAKTLPGEFLKLSVRDQAEQIKEARSRVQPPPDGAASVCHLDTGVNRAHPLIECALSEEHVLAVDPNWSSADRNGHGTEMAGIALYGCLTTILGGSAQIVLRHRLESVKILPDDGAHDPDLYGEVTSQAVSRAEIAAPERVQRVFCLTVTADGRDEGFPSSWSAALDQICAAHVQGNAHAHLFVVSAGNVPLELRHDYPARNHLEGVEDPAQSWNALTVGAYTEQASIHQFEYDGWLPIAPAGRLSPASRTSLPWEDKAWPLKPDVVMEGGNNAIDPATQRADYVDDLSLLTTRVSPAGALVTTTADTSAAAALVARQAAIVWANYSDLWPESVRGLLVHSARWTDAMRQEFPDSHRQERLRCYGYGVPDLQRALWSLSSAATLVVEESLQPFDKEGSNVKTKDMHLHRLPWPTDVLQDLGDAEVEMRVTLSYFIEPSPGRRGWTRKHGYSSHGLRFEVKRPLENVGDFRKRINKAARDDEEDGVEHGSDDRKWEVGHRLRGKGSVHSDKWIGTAAGLANCGVLAVFPVGGWWKERRHLGRWDHQTRYSLIVTIETQKADVDLYTPIVAQIVIPVAS